MEFLAVYIQEAHPTDGWQLPGNVEQASPRSVEERCAVATRCVTELRLEIPAVVDGMDDAVERAYTGWPDRLYVIDRDGRVAWKSEPGPFGFHVAGLEAAIRSQNPL